MTSKIENLIDNDAAETARTFVLGAFIGGCLYGYVAHNEVAQWAGIILAVIWLAWTLTRRAVLGDAAHN
jgi:protease II